MQETGLTTEEEGAIREAYTEPHMRDYYDTLPSRKGVAYQVFSRKPEEVVLIDPDGFRFDLIVAGLSLEHVAYLTLNAPISYKRNLYATTRNEDDLRGIWEIVAAMDADSRERGSTIHQDRMRMVLNYIESNKIVFDIEAS